LERRGKRAGLNKSRLAERYIDEGMRMEDHPGIVFRDGPTGRRAALSSGPDVWEVIATVRASGLDSVEALANAAEVGNLTPAQVRSAVSYYTEYRDEIDERIARNVERPPVHRQLGELRGKIWMSDDFDEPDHEIERLFGMRD
jgi:hypothetical protein